ncbi:fused response regulator/phosphatase [Cryptosporangium arvum]|uniref:SpoIIE-like protein with response regulator receiver domain n=1 Tax=Cryptosporangium arvum DSM 44712 TaxID=927661 RepID=A0A010YRX5_9ACTN|nr:fused response regulator/phosphatase [Cryptosporangium arvum]EXG82965.1 SpoIIE-like protein with response regulator receiver domain [Cryptosporangium arvum DSM 44712]
MTGPESAATVLVVDDAAANRYILGTWLRRAGHRVVEAATGTEALARVDDSDVDLVFLDVNLPDLDGFTVCDRIKNNPAAAGVPVVFVSATSVGVSDRARGLSEGADAYLTEPIDPDELVATAHAMLRYSRARQRAERLARRLALLAGATLNINAARSVEDVLTAAATGAAAVFDAPAVASAVDHDGEGITVAASADRSRAYRHPAAGGYAEEGVRLVTDPPPRWRHALESSDADAPWLASVVPARPRRAPTAVALLRRGTAHEDEDRDLLSQLGQATALAVDALRSYAEERTVALTIQHSLLPRDLPPVRGAEVAFRYVPAIATAEIGGDFYEIAEVDDRLLVAIGDVVGHSLHAATVMAELRHALRAYAVDGHGPAGILVRLDAMLRRYHPGTLATVLLLMVDPATGTAVAATGGHLPPLLATAAGTDYVGVRGTILGVGQFQRPEVTFTIPDGGSIVLVTDGLVEMRGTAIDEGMEQLRQLSVPVDDDLERYCDRVLQALAASRGEDDIALLVLRRTSAEQ